MRVETTKQSPIEPLESHNMTHMDVTDLPAQMQAAEMTTPSHDPSLGLANRATRPLYFVFGWLCVAFGVLGIALPGLPTTVFLLMALWSFSKSSPRFRDWLINHPLLGPFISDWRNHRIVPKKAKYAAGLCFTFSVSVIALTAGVLWTLVFVGAVATPVMVFLLSCPSNLPDHFED